MHLQKHMHCHKTNFTMLEKPSIKTHMLHLPNLIGTRLSEPSKERKWSTSLAARIIAVNQVWLHRGLVQNVHVPTPMQCLRQCNEQTRVT